MRLAESKTPSQGVPIASKNVGEEVLRWAIPSEWKPQRAVFVADNDPAIWIVANLEAVRAFPAAHVVLNGRFDPAKRTVQVEKVTPAAAH
jgi:hypothetical protein